jgi:hypothetical protein
MTRRERLEAKLDKRRDWAASAANKSTERFNTAHALVANIPMGQPVLVGHHSEKAHRRVLDRSWNAMGKACELSKLADHHVSKAAGLACALAHNIFSDDPDALENIQARIDANEAKRDTMKKVNALYRKKDVAGLAAMGVSYEGLKAKLAEAGGYWGSAPHLPYEMTNLGARIRTDKERLGFIKRQQANTAAAEASPSGVLIQQSAGSDYVRVIFAEKPERSILNDLRGAGFHWGAGHWAGKKSALPASVSELLSAPAANLDVYDLVGEVLP